MATLNRYYYKQLIRHYSLPQGLKHKGIKVSPEIKIQTSLKSIKDMAFSSIKNIGQFCREIRIEGKVVNIHCNYLKLFTGTT